MDENSAVKIEKGESYTVRPQIEYRNKKCQDVSSALNFLEWQVIDRNRNANPLMKIAITGNQLKLELNTSQLLAGSYKAVIVVIWRKVTRFEYPVYFDVYLPELVATILNGKNLVLGNAVTYLVHRISLYICQNSFIIPFNPD